MEDVGLGSGRLGAAAARDSTSTLISVSCSSVAAAASSVGATACTDAFTPCVDTSKLVYFVGMAASVGGGGLSADNRCGDGDGDGDGGDGGGEGEGVLRRAVHYCSHQNSSLTEEFEELQTDWRPLAWADAAFGAPPAATNLWMGAGPCRNQGLHGRGSSAGQAVDWPRLAEARGARGTAWR